MKDENTPLDFNNQQFYIGIDVHKNNWTVTVRSNKMVMKTFSMNPSVSDLCSFLESRYPGGEYHSVYEAGFSGYWIHRELEKRGIRSRIAAPTEIPTSNKEKNGKSDPVDSRKLARELENGSLEGIYVPGEFRQEFRSLVRQRYQIIRSQTRVKNQVKSYLLFYGHNLPKDYEMRHWSNKFIDYLRGLSLSSSIGKDQLDIYLDEIIYKREQLVRLTKAIRNVLRENKEIEEKVRLLCTVPGIGFTTAVVLAAELMEIDRFKSFDKLASYCGLVPSVRGTNGKEIVLGIKMHHNRYIRQLLVESSWMAVRKDPAMTKSYNELTKRMIGKKAIIKIAKKLLSRISCVWRTGKEYKCSYS